MKFSLFFLLFLGPIGYVAAQLSVTAADVYVDEGTQIQYTVAGAGWGNLTYEIRDVGPTGTLPLLSSGTVAITNGQASIPFSPSEPGFYACKVTQNWNSSTCTAAFKPHEVGIWGNIPSNWQSFWVEQKAKLTLVAPDVQLEYQSTNGYCKTYKINAMVLNNKRVYGFITIPNGTGSFPAVVQLPPFGASANIVQANTEMATRLGVIMLNINIHPNPTNQEGPANYASSGIDDPETFYYRHSILGIVRLIDYLQTRSDFNGKVATLGHSQGGGLSMLAAGIDNRISVVMESVGTHCAQSAPTLDKPASFPFYLDLASSLGFDTLAVLSAARFYDASFAMRFFDGNSFHGVGYRDSELCPPSPNFSAINAGKGRQIVLHGITMGHSDPQEFTNLDNGVGIAAFLRRIWPETQTPPWPWPQSTLGFWLDAGSDKTLSSPGNVTVAATMKNENVTTTWPVIWRKVSGPGAVSFSNKNIVNPTVSFSAQGNYVIACVAEIAIGSMDKAYTIQDYVNVTVNSTSTAGIIVFADNDNDGFGAGVGITTNQLNPGFSFNAEDCNDWNAAIFPEAQEIALNNWDDDCDGAVDEVCANPTIFKNTRQSATSTQLTWTPDQDALSYQIKYKLAGTAVFTSLNSTQPSLLLTGLVANQNYDFLIRTNCVNAGFLPWSGLQSFFFAGDVACDRVKLGTTVHISTTSEQIFWNAEPNALGYRIRYRKTGANQAWIMVNVAGNIAKTTLSGLLANTTYEYQVRANCGGNWAIFSTVLTFKTQSVANQQVTESKDNDGLLFYPNPTNNFLFFDTIDSMLTSVSLTDVNGIVLLEATTEQIKGGLEVFNWTDGLYFIQFTGKNGARKSKRFLKKS